MTTFCYKVQALTPIWTGDVNQGGHRLITTGLLGSIRWWFEVMVRGLGGKPCDPTHHPENQLGPCPDKKKQPTTDHGYRCVVCEFFGCTGWARKFRFEVVDGNGQPVRDAIHQGQEFTLRFTPLRPIQAEEWALLDLTLHLIADYGAIGGKTVLKPSDEPGRQNLQHQDFGLIKLLDQPASTNQSSKVSKHDLQCYVQHPHWRQVDHNDYAWASLNHFWCVNGRYLARQSADTSSFNRVIGRPQPKNQASNPQCDSWIAGRRPNVQSQTQPESKKVFSFKNPPRTFGFVQDADDLEKLVNQLKKQLANEWSEFQGHELETDDQILNKLLSGVGGLS